MRKKIVSFLILLLALFAVPMLQGCIAPDNGDSITENILVSMNNEDYKNFSQDFSEGLKAKLPEEDFAGVLAATKGTLGDYVVNSKQLKFISSLDGYGLIYLAKFVQQGEQQVYVYLYNKKVIALQIGSFTIYSEP